MHLLLIFILLTNVAFAEDIVAVEKGDPSPDKGFFVSIDQMKKFRQVNEDKKLLEKEIASFKQLSLTQDQRVEIAQNTSNFYQEELMSQQRANFWTGAGGFIAGAALTGLTAYGLVKAIK